jgi:hypothetical protein
MKTEEDYFTSTVDGAAGFERTRAGRESCYPDDYIPDDNYSDNDEINDKCNCSDPGCPCGGHKIGGV